MHYHYHERQYRIHQGVPATVEARCRLVDDAVVRNPHFDRERLSMRWAGGHQWPAWLVSRGATVDYREHPASWASTGAIGRGGPRSMRSAFITARWTVDWPGTDEKRWLWFSRVEAYPATGASMQLSAQSVERGSQDRQRLLLYVPWDKGCGLERPR
jgi:hypothetical protein